MTPHRASEPSMTRLHSTPHRLDEDDPRRGPEASPADSPADSPEPPAARSTSMVIAYTDGACIRNPGPGGWGVYVEHPDGRTVELGGGDEKSTNNRMELHAA